MSVDLSPAVWLAQGCTASRWSGEPLAPSRHVSARIRYHKDCRLEFDLVMVVTWINTGRREILSTMFLYTYAHKNYEEGSQPRGNPCPSHPLIKSQTVITKYICTYILDFKVDTPHGEVVRRVRAHQVRVVTKIVRAGSASGA